MINIVYPETQKFEPNQVNVWSFIAEAKPNLIKSMQNVKAGTATKIPARKCTCVELDVTTARLFLNENHLMGYASAAYKYGLYFQNELVMVITVCSSRYDRFAEYEIIRLASKQNTVVVGGASKLLKFIKQQLSPTSLLSYSDNMLGDGNVYRDIGFTLDGETQIGYFWYKNGEFISRTSTQKHKLRKLFSELSEDDIKNKTENQIMTEFGYIKIKNMGNKRWIMGSISKNQIHHKFHYVYKTTRPLIDDKFYIGIHSTNNLNDGYLGSGTIIQHSIRKYGKHLHEIEILDYAKDRDELHEREKQYVTLSELQNPNCMNILLGGINRRESLRTNTGRIRIHHPDNPKTSFYVRREDFDEFVSMGYKKGFGVVVNQPKIFYKDSNGTVKRSNNPPTYSTIIPPFWNYDNTELVHIQRDGEKTKVKHTEILDTDVIGWDGPTSTQGKKLVSKNGILKYVSPDEVDRELSDGWELGGFVSHLSKKQVSKNGIVKIVEPDQVEQLLNDGWELGRGIGNSPITNKKLMIKDGERQYVNTDKVDEMLKNGWAIGGHPGSCSNKKTISKDGETKFVFEEDVESFIQQGWSLGRGVGNSPTKNKKWMFKGTKTEYVDEHMVQSLINDGWEEGNGLIQVKKGDEIKKVYHSEAVDLILNHGWTLRKVRLDAAPIQVIRVAREVGMKIPEKFKNTK